jgi:alkanesulfonate monooxygenase SsuD/methylene tetrahydromethanopterin reductase-like flavin-dependent oxidoreductase (luciferase family)
MRDIARHETGLSVAHQQQIWRIDIDGAGEILGLLSDERLDLVWDSYTQFANYARSAHAMLRPDGLAYGLQRYARTAMSAAELTGGTEKKVAFEVDPTEPPVVLSAIPGGEALIAPGELIDAFFAALLCRDQPSLQRFAALDLAALKSSSVASSDQTRALVLLCQQVARKDSAAKAKATEIIQQCSPRAATASWATLHIMMIVRCQAEILLCMLESSRSEHGRNESDSNLGARVDTANKTLIDALQSHQRYYTAGEDKGGGDPREGRGFLCIHACALAAWMHDMGLPRRVTSGYLCEALITGKTLPAAVLPR